MNSKRSTCIIAAAFAGLAMSMQVVAQEDRERREHQEHRHEHHKYKLIQMGAFGGPNSTMEQPGKPPRVPFVKILNRRGAEIGTGDTSILDPFCYLGGSPCRVGYVFRWEDGVESNLGVLPQNDRTPVAMP